LIPCGIHTVEPYKEELPSRIGGPHHIIAVALLAPVALVNGQVMACTDPCILESNSTCQEWIDSKTDWRGSCCSFADVTDDLGATGIKCRMTIAGTDGWCGWATPESVCPQNATECVYAGEQLSVFDSSSTCPDSVYDPFAVPAGNDGNNTTTNSTVVGN
jgi:hypothetical protein